MSSSISTPNAASRRASAGRRPLKQAAERCELVIFLVSPEWAASKWCLAEFLLAKNLNKRIFGVIVEPTPFERSADRDDGRMAACRSHGGQAGPSRSRVTPPPGDKTVTVAFAKDGLERLRIGLMQAGLDARYFAWPPEHDPERPPYRGLSRSKPRTPASSLAATAPPSSGLDLLRGLREAAPPRLLVILGASGAGKSSFLRAGLLPRLARESQHFLPLPVIRPERAALTGETGLIASLETGAEGGGAPAHARRHPQGRRGRRGERRARSWRTSSRRRRLPDTGDGRRRPSPRRWSSPSIRPRSCSMAEGAEEARAFLDLAARSRLPRITRR